MPYDVELLRDLLLYLEGRQVSPRASVVIDLRDESLDLDTDPQTFELGLNLLLELDYIEGPGAESSGVWLFRKLTRKGVEFLRAARDAADWARMKQRRNAKSLG